MIVVHAVFEVEPDRREEALETFSEVASRSRNDEDGCLDYRVAVDVDDENVVRFFERYEDDAAFDAHIETDHYQQFASERTDLIVGEPDVVRVRGEEIES